MNFKKCFRTVSLTIASVIAAMVFTVAAQAAELSVVAYNLANGASSTNITPAANKPVLVIGNQTVAGNVGSGETTIVNSNPGDAYLVWSGLESAGGGPTSGFSPTPGTHIIFIDNSHCLDLEVNNATSFIVHNACGVSQAGRVTLVW